MNCPCQSGKRYAACCEPFHKGKIPEKAEELMRSRYSAYALGLISYISETTHPASKQWRTDKARWEEEIRVFSASTVFKGLEILDVSEGPAYATVTFRAELEQGGRDVSFTEKSSFERVEGKWFYRDALFIL